VNRDSIDHPYQGVRAGYCRRYETEKAKKKNYIKGEEPNFEGTARRISYFQKALDRSLGPADKVGVREEK